MIDTQKYSSTGSQSQLPYVSLSLIILTKQQLNQLLLLLVQQVH